MPILYFFIGAFVYGMCEFFSIPKLKQKISNQVYDFGIFAMQPLTGRNAVLMGKFAIYFIRVGIVVYILLGAYIFI